MQAQPVSNGLDTDHIMVMPTKTVLGAEVRCGDLRQLGNAAFQQLYQAFLDHLVIVVRGQRLSDSELVTIGRRLGELDEVPYAKTGKEKVRAIPEIVVVSNVLEDGQPIGVLRDAEVVWHSDNSYPSIL